MNTKANAYTHMGDKVSPTPYQQQPYPGQQPQFYVMSGADLIQARRVFIADRLQNHYPSKLVLFYALIIALIGIVAIVLQSVLIANQAFLYYIGNGIWAGAFCLFLPGST